MADFDPFAEATPEEQEAQKKLQETAQQAKKEKKKEVGKSTLVLNIKPASDEVNLDELEVKIRNIQKDGLLWGKSQRQELCYGIFMIQMGAVVTDDVSVDDIQEELESWDDEIQSTEIAAFQKI